MAQIMVMVNGGEGVSYHDLPAGASFVNAVSRLAGDVQLTTVAHNEMTWRDAAGNCFLAALRNASVSRTYQLRRTDDPTWLFIRAANVYFAVAEAAGCAVNDVPLPVNNIFKSPDGRAWEVAQ